MQPKEPQIGQMPPTAVNPPVVPAQAPAGPAVGAGLPGGRKSRLRLWLALVGGVLAVFCLGGVGVAVSLYDNATKIQRSAPDAVVDNFLRAYLVDRSDQEAALYECTSGGSFTELAALRSDVLSREKQYSIGIRFTWTSLMVATNGGHTTVSTDLFRAISDGSERTSDRWQFTMVDQDGWRVCGATQVS